MTSNQIDCGLTVWLGLEHDRSPLRQSVEVAVRASIANPCSDLPRGFFLATTLLSFEAGTALYGWQGQQNDSRDQTAVPSSAFRKWLALVSVVQKYDINMFKTLAILGLPVANTKKPLTSALDLVLG